MVFVVEEDVLSEKGIENQSFSPSTENNSDTCRSSKMFFLLCNYSFCIWTAA